jgi:predicted transcriptional regulator
MGRAVELTKAEEQVMQILWSIGKGFVNDILDRFPEPRPAYNTVSTIIRILERKGYVGHDSLGKSHLYYPKVERNTYARSYLRNFVHRYFSDSYQGLTSFFLREDDVSLEELELMRHHIEERISKKTKK